MRHMYVHVYIDAWRCVHIGRQAGRQAVAGYLDGWLGLAWLCMALSLPGDAVGCHGLWFATLTLSLVWLVR